MNCKKREFLENRGISLEFYTGKIEGGANIAEYLKEVRRNIQVQEFEEKLKGSVYANEIKEDVLNRIELLEYLKKNSKEKNNELRIIARFRLGSKTRSVRVWEKEENNVGRLCGEKEETRKRVMEEFKYTRKEGIDWKEVLNGKNKYLNIMLSIIWKRKEATKRNVENNNVAAT